LVLVHASHGPPSSLHSKVEFASEEVKPNVGEFDEVAPLGPPALIEVSGGWVSTVHVRLTIGPWFPTLSMPRAEKVYVPSPRLE
jgi:hypothetical protein